MKIVYEKYLLRLFTCIQRMMIQKITPMLIKKTKTVIAKL